MDIKTAELDAYKVEDTVKLIKETGAEILVNLALPYQDLVLMDACLEAGIHYLDTANYEPEDEAKFEYHWQWAYQERFKEAGLTAILGSGFDPGVTSVFAKWLKKHKLDHDPPDRRAGRQWRQQRSGIRHQLQPGNQPARSAGRGAAIGKVANGNTPPP